MEDLVGRVATALTAAGIPYMLTGSLASSIHGTGRTTYDIDLVIDPTLPQLLRFLRSLPATEYSASQAAALDAFERRSQFNVIDLDTCWKVDLIVRKERPFSRIEFDRRIPADYHGENVMIATAEDVILAKLEWSKAGGSLRQIEDVASILRVRDDLDRTYLEHWVGELGIEGQWREALTAAGR